MPSYNPEQLREVEYANQLISILRNAPNMTTRPATAVSITATFNLDTGALSYEYLDKAGKVATATTPAE